MDLNTVFKLSLYGLMAYVGWMLGVAEEGWIPFGSLPIVLLGYWWCEIQKTNDTNRPRGMGNAVASACGFIAATASLNEFLGDNPEAKLLAGTHLLVYLTWILLLQAKTDYVCWLLMAVGVLQVAVSSVLTSGTWFGFSVIGYVFGAVWTLSVFSLRRASDQFVDGEQSKSTAGPLGYLMASAKDVDSQSLQNLSSEAFGAIQHPTDNAWLSLRFVGGVAFSAAGGLLVSALFFLFIPRVWVGSAFNIGDEDIPAIRRRMVTGFSSEVRLGDIGSILENLDPVLEMRLFNHTTGVPLMPQTYAARLGQPEPMIRGAVLTSYLDGRWKSDRLADSPPLRLVPRPDLYGVRQEIRLEPVNSNVLFCLGRASAITDENKKPFGRQQWFSDLAFRSSDQPRTGVLVYTAFSELPEDQGKNVIGFEVHDNEKSRYLTTNYLTRNTEVPNGFDRTYRLANQIVATEQTRQRRNLTDLEKAHSIETYLRDSGKYSYTLNLSVQDPSIDVIEDFLFNRREGHCEYFASALAIMLRSVGIPARLVTGFKGGAYESSTQTLVVRQCYAHAWVEAFIDGHAWVTLDATPASSRANSIASVGTGRTLWNDVGFKLSGMWSENVVNITLDKQEEILYRPLRELVASVWETVQILWRSPRDSLRDLWANITNIDNWFSAGGAFTVLLVGSVIWYSRLLIRRIRLRWKGSSLAELSSRRRIEFYERFVRVMKDLGCRRDSAQTHSEFAKDVKAALTERIQETNLTENQAQQLDSVADSPVTLTEMFYRVRFGNESLSQQEILQIESILSRLESLVQKKVVAQQHSMA